MPVNLIATTEGALMLLASAQDWQQSVPGNAWRVGLFANNYTIIDATVLGDLTPASFPGYAYASPNWTNAALVGGVPTCISDVCSWTQTSSFPSTFYGIYVADAGFSKLAGAANTPSPVTLTSGQPSWSTVVNLTAISQY